MKLKARIKEFLQMHRRTLTSLASIAIVVALVVAVALNTTGENYMKQEEAVNTSAPTKITFVMPVKDGVIIKDFSDTTLKYNATLKQWESHKAVDIKGSDDADVLACYDGEVVSVDNNYLTGTVVTIKHTDSLQTVYSSMSENVLVKAGDKVMAGQIIGKVSTSAKSESADGAHLHFEVLQNNIKVDPALYLEIGNK